MKTPKEIVFLSLILLAFSAQLTAQTTTGTFVGVVRDTTGAVIPGVEVETKEVQTGLVRVALTDDSGLYRVTNLPRGFYNVKAVLSGFKTVVHENIELTTNEVRRLDFTLQVGEISDQVTVAGTASLVSTEEGRLSRIVDNKKITDLPLIGRNFTQLAFLQPGVVSGGIGSNTGGFSVGGARSRGTSFTIDGADSNDPVVPGSPQVGVPLDSVEEFRLVRNTFSAEFGRLSGAQLNIVTKSGTNAIHGTAWWFHRNRALNANNFFSNRARAPKPPFILNQVGAEAGGPVIQDRTFFYGAYELSASRTSSVSTRRFVMAEAEPVASGPIAKSLIKNFPAGLPLEPKISRGGIPVVGEGTIVVPGGSDTHNWVAKLDHEWLNGNNRISGRYIEERPISRAPSISNTFVPGFRLDTSFVSHNFALSDTHVFSPAVVNEFHLGFTRDAFAWRPQNPQVPTITISGGIQGYGAATNMPQNRFPMVYQLADTFSWNRGKHGLKFGADYRFITRTRTFDALRRGSYSFTSIDDFLADKPLSYSVRINLLTGDRGSGHRRFDRSEIMFFFQDDWKAHPNLTLNLGLRYENFRPPTEKTVGIAQPIVPQGSNIFDVVKNPDIRQVEDFYNSDNNNFAPRFGFAWDILGDGKTSLRGGYGLNYERLFQNVDENIQFNPPLLATIVFDRRARQTVPYGVPSVVPSGLAGGPIPRGTSLTVLDPKISTAYMQSFFLGIQRAIFGNTTLEINYVGSKGTKLPVTLNYNRFDGDLLDGKLDRANAQFGNISLIANRISSTYHSLQLEANRQFSAGLSFQASYTFSRFIDEDSDNFAHDEPVTIFNIHGNQRGLSLFHTPHRFVSNWIWELPFLRNQQGILGQILGGWVTTGIVTLQTGRPFTVSTNATFGKGGDFNADGTLNDRPNLNGAVDSAKTGNRPVDGILKKDAFDTKFQGLGNLGRNVFLGPGFADVDLGVHKNFRIHWLGEEGRLQFRTELSNAFNRVNFSQPTGNLNSAFFGKSQSAGSARQIQMALKLIF